MGSFQPLKPLSLHGNAIFVTGLLGAAIFLWQSYGFNNLSIVYWIFCGFIWRIALLDWQYGLIFDRITLPFGILGFCFALFFGALPLQNFLFAAFLSGGSLYLLRLISHGSMGGGDVKFAFCLGLWLGIKGVIIALFLAFFTGGIVAFILLLVGRKKQKASIAFAPFLSLGAMLAMLFGDILLTFYGGFF